MITQFIFGYGSLICSHSRAVTSPEHAHKVATPVMAQGIERVWSKRTNRNMTAMGISFSEEASTVGVLLPVSEEEIQKFDIREQGYDRHELDLSDVNRVPFLNDEHYKEEDHDVFLEAKKANAAESIKLWVYVQRQDRPPTEEHPIVQSYVDTILRGCLNVGGEKFARAFIETTKGWNPNALSDLDDDKDGSVTTYGSIQEESDDDASSVWVDDRHQPVYVRGDPAYMLKHADKLDKLLRKYRPEDFQHRKSFDSA